MINTTYMVIKTIQFGILANMNIGILTSIFTLAAAINTVIGRVLFNERLGQAKIIGIIIVILGVIWISIAKGNR